MIKIPHIYLCTKKWAFKVEKSEKMTNVSTCDPRITTKDTSCRPSLFCDSEQNSVFNNINKIKGNTHFVKVVLSKVSLIKSSFR